MAECKTAECKTNAGTSPNLASSESRDSEQAARSTSPRTGTAPHNPLLPDPLLLLSALTRALAHRARTPLTVISNELTYLESQGHDCGRALQRAKDINELLKVATALGSAADHREETVISAVLRTIFPAVQISDDVTSYARMIDRLHFTALLRLLARLSADLKEDPQAVASASFTREGSDFVIQVSCSLAERTNVNGSFSSLTELFSERLHLDLVEPPLIDAAAHRCELQIVASLTDGLFSIRCRWNSNGVNS